jgi:hypothetical protein
LLRLDDHVSMKVRYKSGSTIKEVMQESLPVVDGASVVIVIAGQVSIKLARTHSQQAAIISNDDLALVINGTPIKVVAWNTEGWKAYADTEGAELRGHRLAEPWARVALSKVVVTVLTAEGAILLWRRDASALVTVATA